MRKISWLLMVTLFLGCTAAQIPVYLQDKKPYTKRFYANFDDTLTATRQALEDLGWTIEKTTDPSVYEQTRSSAVAEQELLILTEIRQTALILGSRYAKMNIFLRSNRDVSEVEIRYLTVTSLPFRSLQSYQNDAAVDRIFDRITAWIEQ